jgi:pyruvate/2-oxoglutarate dehydrogenase complex dihydrolipoamide dehydrogenase (E3) component
LGAEVTLIDGADQVLPREPERLGSALGEVLRRDGIELILGVHATDVRRLRDEYVLTYEGGGEVRGDRLLVATGRRPRIAGIGPETVGVQADPRGIHVDDHLRAGERLWAIGDVSGILLLTHVGEYQGDIVASNILGEPRCQLRRGTARRLYRPASRRSRRNARAVQRDGTGFRGFPDRDIHPRLRRVERVSHPAQRR